MAVTVKTTINDNAPEGSLELRFKELYQRPTTSQSAEARELVLSGFMMRELGVSQQLIDKERAGDFRGMTLLQRRRAIAQLIALGDEIGVADAADAEVVEETDESGPDIGAWKGLGG